MQIKVLAAVILAFLTNVVGTHDAYAVELNVPFHGQQTPVWCWAATVGMVGEYLTDKRASDCEILSAYDRMFGGPGTCCLFPERCMRTGGSDEMTFIMSELFGLSGYHHVRPLSYRQLREEIDKDRPFIVALRSIFAGHVVVVSGYKLPDRVVILDPLSGRHVVSYRELRSNWQIGVWTETLTLDKPQDTSDYDDFDDYDNHDVPTPYCCDVYGRPRCEIISNAGPPGSVCFCPGQGNGVTCY